MNINTSPSNAPVGHRVVEAELSRDLVSMVERIIERDQRISILQRGSDRYRHQLRAEESNRKKTDARIKDLEKKVAYLRAENRRVKEAADKREASRERDMRSIRRKYENSTSWKMTAPVRAIARLFGK